MVVDFDIARGTCPVTPEPTGNLLASAWIILTVVVYWGDKMAVRAGCSSDILSSPNK